MISVLSQATHVNCTGFGLVKVLKFLYLIRSNALTVPSLEDDTIALPLFAINCMPVIAALCSLKVTNQNQFSVFQTFILPSSLALAR